MALTGTQPNTLKADMLGASNAALAALIAANDTAKIADYYNTSANLTKVWRLDATPGQVNAVIVWANLTPLDNADGTQLWANRSLACQGKQFNVQLMLSSGEQYLPADVQTFRDGLQDSLTGVPSAAGGSKQAAGWVAVQDVLRRFGTRLEVLFSVVQGNANKSDVYGYSVTPPEIAAALAS